MTLTLVAVFGIFQLILFLLHADIYQALVAAFGWHWPWLSWLFILLSISFVSSSVLTFRFTNAFITWYYRFAAYWFGLTQFLFGGSVIYFFLSYTFYHIGIYISPMTLGAFSFGIPFLIHCYATWQTNQIEVTRVSVSSQRAGNAWPEFWRDKKVLFVSDVHLGAVRGEGFAKKVVTAIVAESPEIVLIGGDIFDGVRCRPMPLLAPFVELRPPQGVYFASGNHEYIEDTIALLKEVREVGIHILKNQIVDVRGIQFAGVDWKDTYKKEEFKKILAGMRIDPAKPSILMRHEPNHLEVAEHAGVSLTLAGHTHAGQIWPLGFITRSIYKGFDYGLKQLGHMMVYTSSGVGTWGPPLRFLTKAEIVAITLK